MTKISGVLPFWSASSASNFASILNSPKAATVPNYTDQKTYPTLNSLTILPTEGEKLKDSEETVAKLNMTRYD